MKRYLVLALFAVILFLLPLFSGAVAVPVTQRILTGLSDSPSYTFLYGEKDSISPRTYDMEALDIGPTSLKLRWATDEMSACTVSWSLVGFGDGRGVGSNIISNNLFNTYHLVAVNFLNPKTAYNFFVTCKDGAGNESPMETFVATTTDNPDITPPSEITNLRIINESKKALFAWDNPTESDFAGVVIVRKSDDYPVGRQDGVLVFRGNNDIFVDSPLEAGRMYYYLIVAYDRAGNHSRGVLFTANPFGVGENSQDIRPIPVTPVIEIAVSIADFEFWQDGVGMKYDSSDIVFDNNKDLTIVMESANVPVATDRIIINFLGVENTVFVFDKIKDGRYLVVIPRGSIFGESSFVVRFFDGNNKLLGEVMGSSKVIEKTPIPIAKAMDWRIFLVLTWSTVLGKIFLSLIMLTTIPLILLAYWAWWILLLVSLV